MNNSDDEFRSTINEFNDAIDAQIEAFGVRIEGCTKESPAIGTEIGAAIDGLRRGLRHDFDICKTMLNIIREVDRLNKPARIQFLKKIIDYSKKRIDYLDKQAALPLPDKSDKSDDPPIGPVPPEPPQDVNLTVTEGKRVPMAEHRKRLIQFIRNKGQCTRAGMISGTGIPEGSISALLSNSEDFEQVQHGLWKLKEGK